MGEKDLKYIKHNKVTTVPFSGLATRRVSSSTDLCFHPVQDILCLILPGNCVHASKSSFYLEPRRPHPSPPDRMLLSMVVFAAPGHWWGCLYRIDAQYTFGAFK